MLSVLNEYLKETLPQLFFYRERDCLIFYSCHPYKNILIEVALKAGNCAIFLHDRQCSVVIEHTVELTLPNSLEILTRKLLLLSLSIPDDNPDIPLLELLLEHNIEQCPTCKWYVETWQLLRPGTNSPDLFCDNCRPDGRCTGN